MTDDNQKGSNWESFQAQAPQIAAIGRQLLHNPNQGEVGLLATVTPTGLARIAPVCPIFSSPGIYLLVGRHTPKLKDLNANGHYALHAMVGADDLEFQVSGPALAIVDVETRRRVLADVPFPDCDPEDPIFELHITQAIAVTWPEPGRSSKSVWRSA